MILATKNILFTGEPMLALTNVFKKHLKEYATRILLENLPKLSQQANISAANLMTRLGYDSFLLKLVLHNV